MLLLAKYFFELHICLGRSVAELLDLFCNDFLTSGEPLGIILNFSQLFDYPFNLIIGCLYCSTFLHLD